MSYDIIIRGGRVVDGTGAPPRMADVGVVSDRVAEIGDLKGQTAHEVVDAEGHVVSPGFIDGHTHMDAQIFWDPLGSSSCWHGVTSAIMGNCGFTLAPCSAENSPLVMKSLERAEDISRPAMQAGIKWSWETFPQYLDTLEGLPKGINYGVYVGHSALRTYVMGERAFTERANPDELQRMREHLRAGLAAGAAGFSTSRQSNHKTADGGPVPSFLADWHEVCELVNVLSEAGVGVFELAKEDVSNDPEVMDGWLNRLQSLALQSRVPTTYGLPVQRDFPEAWRKYLRMVADTVSKGGKMAIQSHARVFSVLLSWETSTPFDGAPVWEQIRKEPLSVQRQAFLDPTTRAKLVEAAEQYTVSGAKRAGGEPSQAKFDSIFVLDKPFPPHRTVGEIARERRQNPIEVMIDLALEKDFKLFFQQILANEDEADLLQVMLHPNSFVTFTDSGAHVSHIMDSSLQTHLLGYWVREREALPLELAVKKITSDLADFWSLEGRGRLVKGAIADLAIFDPATVSPNMPEVVHDLPAGGRRLRQTATGMLATIVGGKVLLRQNQHTGELPGRLLRNRQADRRQRRGAPELSTAQP